MIKKIAIASGLILLLGLNLYLLVELKMKKRVVYVNTYELYNQFTLKKELEKKLESTQIAKKVVMDSLKAQLNYATSVEKPTEADVKHARDIEAQLYYKEKQFREEDEQQAQQYTNQVWEQLNQYMKDYGKEKGYSFILGANGQGNLMYAEETGDVTKEVVTYVNEKYKGTH
ncbi:MAG: OmpH family outer membrane protein [Bacteroidetes bacterium]|nr:OmpH family outer membrane protein [Bacteroidota bacterium]